MKRRKFSFVLRPVYILLLIPALLLTLSSVLRAFQAQLQPPPGAQTIFQHGDATNSLETSLRDAKLLLPKCSKATSARAKTFVILFMGHSGSTAAITILRKHPDVFIRGLEPVDHGAIASNTRKALLYARTFFKAGLAKNKTAGFKIRPRHILAAPDKWAKLFQEFDTKIIWNYRANIFKQAIGHYPIIYLNDTSRYEGLKVSPKSGKVTKEKNDHVGEFRIHDMRAFYKLLSSRYRGERSVENAVVSLRNKPCILPLSYELLLGNPLQTSLLLQLFLNLRVIPSLQPARKKATDDNMCKVVSNWNEVCHAFFLCQRWRGMMDNSLTGCTCPIVTGVKPKHAHRFCVPEEMGVYR